MAPVTNTRVLFNQIPKDYPVPGQTTIYDTTQQFDLDAPLNGGVLIKVLVLGADPYLRGRMREPPPEGANIKDNFLKPFAIGSPLENYGIGIILRSENAGFNKGDHVYGLLEFQEYTIKTDIPGSRLRVLENKDKLPWSAFIGIAGIPGQTAYVGWKLFAKAKKGDTVFVTSAAGSVGATVIQLAKADGLKVIASAGSDEKAVFAKELGADVAFNYKTKSTMTALQELGHGIDIYWDNVGGEVLDTALVALNVNGRVINCGYISSYITTAHNAKEQYGVKALGLIIPKRISLNGFITTDHKELIKEYDTELPKLIAGGQIKYREHIYHGLEHAGQALLDVLKGNHLGRPVVIISDT